MEKIIIKTPVDFIHSAKSKEADEHPYDICLTCPYLKESCDGPNCLAMLYDRWVEWINELAKRNGITRAAIAEKANISLATVNSALSGKAKDIRLYTAAAITKAVKGGSWGKRPCHFAALLSTGEYEETSEISGTNVAKMEADYQKKIDFLKDIIRYRGKSIKIMAAVIGILGTILIGILIADIFVPNIGWFRF